MLRTFSSINWLELKTLIISSNAIASLEQLPLIDFPKLIYLDLSTSPSKLGSNSFISMKPIRKLHRPQLEVLQLSRLMHK